MRKLFTSSIILVAVLTGCAATSVPAEPSTAMQRLKPEVLQVLPHDPAAFTEGLELVGGTLYEGTGLTGRSVVQSGPLGQAPSTRAALSPELFGEGITVVGPTLWQLTWQNGFAIERDSATLAEQRRVPYSGEGWGLCHQPGDDRLVMSNGSDRLTFRDPRTFAETGAVTVHSGEQTFSQLNELECVGDAVYANVWQTDSILRIDAATGAVTATIDASGLLSAAERGQADVLNGIAAVPGTDRFLLTGKLWPKMFEVRLVPAP
ncbi:MAG: glutaminyl-peptide cyclotransferase [Actinomycetota bacterium]|nr:glutaminyl-peptide cyclotransferase [Actinomycetota bacterium]